MYFEDAEDAVGRDDADGDVCPDPDDGIPRDCTDRVARHPSQVPTRFPRGEADEESVRRLVDKVIFDDEDEG